MIDTSVRRVWQIDAVRVRLDTEEHIDRPETQLELVGKVGEQDYLQAQMGSSS